MEALLQQKKALQSKPFLSYETRLNALKDLREAIKKYESQILDALYKDLHKSSFEAYTTEVGYVLNNLSYAIKHLKSWMKDKKVSSPFYQIGSRSHISYIPYGQVLLIGPYNYPFQLVIEPLIGALSAGNVVTIKPSELTPHTEHILKELISNTFDPAYIQVITGGVEVTQEILNHPFDYIFFTGSTRVGQIVYEKASKHLTPVTLELGGKSPVIVDKTANLKIAAKRIAYGKVLNAGQTCIAPDYVYVHSSVKDEFITYLKDTIDTFTSNKESLTHIVSERHITRLEHLLDPKKVIVEGSFKNGHIKPYVMDNITPSDKVMKEEIFGPILPILTYDDLNTCISFIKSEPKPLALYLFTEDKHVIQTIKDHLSFGGMAINDTILHITNPNLPFGGIGSSGIGHYTGKFSFYTFSHPRGIMQSSSKVDLGLAYPPYNEKKLKTIKQVLK